MPDTPTHLRFTEDFEREWLAVDEAEQDRVLHDAYRIARSHLIVERSDLLWALRAAMAEINHLTDLLGDDDA